MNLSIEKLLAGDNRELGRLISLTENNQTIAKPYIDQLGKGGKSAQVIGITGPPGAGKSTLVAALATDILARDYLVAILAIDPSSPITGGAVLGDRIRMASLAANRRVFIRSMGARGLSGGLSSAAEMAIDALRFSNFDFVIVETVGAGQGDVNIAQVVDKTIVVVTPDYGDEIQIAKSGILEIGDIFVVNKSEGERGARKAAELAEMISLTKFGEVIPGVFRTDARSGTGVDLLANAIIEQ